MGTAQPLTTPRSVTFRGPTGERVEATVVSIDPDPETRRVTVEVTPEDYEAIASGELFHLSEAAGGPGADDFRPARTVRIELRPDADVGDALAGLGDDPEELALAMADAEPLLRTDAWYAAAVSTEVELPPEMEGTLREGYRTVWSEGAGIGLAPALTTVARLVVAGGGKVEALSDVPGVQWTTDGVGGSWRSVALASDDGRIAVYGVLPTTVDASRFADVALVLAHLNSGLIIGNWELTVDTGEICMKTSIDGGDEALGPELIGRLVGRNAEATGAAFDLLERLARGTITVDDAVGAVGAVTSGPGQPPA